MKKILITLVTIAACISAAGQQPVSKNSSAGPSVYQRCATSEIVKILFARHPERKALAQRLAAQQPGPEAFRKASRLSTITTLPVVIHIVLPNPYLITDEVIQSQIDALNLDFSGLNPDSTNIPNAFRSLRGHSFIRFALARKDPSGQQTNGIVRLSSNAKASPYGNMDSIKYASLGGSAAWDPTRYINIWVGDISGASGVLGYTVVPGSGTLQEDGIVCNRIGFGISDCNVSVYNRARTVVHEMGHYFGLNHTWGDDETESNKCSGDDFRALTDDGSTYTLPLSLYNPHGKGNTSDDIGDTPNQSIASSSCLSGVVTDNCSPSSPGIMYQNYMDYTLDDCYSLFTSKQVERMEYVLQTYRAALITSDAGSLPAGAITTDASPVNSVNPGGYESASCQSVSYPSSLTCSGSFVPKVRIRNNGTATIHTLTVGYVLNNGAPVMLNLSPALGFGNTQVVSFPAINLGPGTYTFKYFTANVNGAAPDQVTANDTLSATLTIQQPVTLPLTEGFEGTAYPPAGWTISNPDQANTWEITTPGNNSAHSLYVDNFDENTDGQTDEFISPKILLANNNPVVISFDLAHKYYPDPSYYDRLQVLVSTDCGATFTSVFDKSGPSLATAGSSSDSYLNPAAADWKNQKIVLDGSVVSSGSIIISFKVTSSWGNNIFIDNIDIKNEISRDIRMVAIASPVTTTCQQPITPVASVSNAGFSTLTGFTISYAVDNGAPVQTTVSNISLAPDAQMNVPLTVLTPSAGAHSITVYTAAPVASSGTGDQYPVNDTLRKSFFVTGNMDSPVTEGFENTVFPPAGWVVENPDAQTTWERTTSASSTGTASMMIRNYNYTGSSDGDHFISPLITGNAAYDSTYLSFDYAYAGRGTSAPDTLQVLATTDCGQTFISVWKEWGNSLQTTAAGVNTAFVPAAGDWKNVTLNLYGITGNKDFQLRFIDKSNGRNNLYIDNIRIYGVTLPARLKQQGYLLYPNPMHNQLIVRTYRTPVNLQSIAIYTISGQMVWTKKYNGDAYTQMPVDVSNLARGVYIVKLVYADKTVVEKVIKQ